MSPVNYSKIAQTYDLDPLRQKHIDSDLAEFLAHLKPQGPVNVVDLACGTGNWLQVNRSWYFARDIEWTGIDSSPEMLAKAKEKNPDIRFVEAAAEDLPLEGHSVDFLVCEFGYHLFSDKMQAFREIFRVLSPEGVLVLRDHDPSLSDYTLTDFLFPTLKERNISRFLTVRDLKAQLDAAGFEAIDSFTEEKRQNSGRSLTLHCQALRQRTFSNLWVVSNDEFDAGIAKLNHLLETEPELIENLFRRERHVYVQVVANKFSSRL